MADETTDVRVDLYKMEYERCAQRYDDLYKAVWTNFSYMATLSGAILVFSKDVLGVELSVVLSCAPLLFWYWATFRPLNEYGDQVAQRAATIEKQLNAALFYPKDLSELKGLSHFSDFVDRSVRPVKPAKSPPPTYIKWLAAIFCLVFVSLAALTPSITGIGDSALFRLTFGVGLVIFLVTIGLLAWILNNEALRERLRVRYGVSVLAAILHVAAIAAICAYWFRPLTVPDPNGGSRSDIILRDDKGNTKFAIDINNLAGWVRRTSESASVSHKHALQPENRSKVLKDLTESIRQMFGQ